ncbi:2'-5' RNA ligase family protein [Microlunatus panaciterrae]|uniref:2'-5' RNA ligase n=1 Tax=Microlunatus panaciterrae TaxID=400768 RepID=A0ABS2RJP4_9ACTN|nr:2'-5' RNA ligase family protein [Microlunatus panaciterrae]MBM7799226.1 2'-5' RNA ligase [Microlunatus panaciterrae]
MGIQSVELLLDEQGDAAIRAQWQALLDAGLPSSGSHPAPSNRPHITLTARQRIDPARENVVQRLLSALPLPIQIGSPTIFGRPHRSMVLVRTVVPTAALLRFQLAVHLALGDSPDVSRVCLPDAWTPHVTLARLPAAQISAAITVIAGMDCPPVNAVRLRRWDSDAAREWML